MKNKLTAVTVRINVDINDLVDELIESADHDTIFELIKALELKCESGDFLERVYLHFKKEYEKEEELDEKDKSKKLSNVKK